MYRKLVKDVMIPVDKYPTIQRDSNMLDAVIALWDAQNNAPPEQPAFRAVLVLNEKNEIIGKIGLIGFLKALEPKYQQVFDFEKLTRVSLSASYIESMMNQFNLWDPSSIDICQIASTVMVEEIMSPVEHNIDENESIMQGIHKMIMWQTLSILVKSGNEIVGILRLSDLYADIENFLIYNCKKK